MRFIVILFGNFYLNSGGIGGYNNMGKLPLNPPPIFFDRTPELSEWKDNLNSQILSRIASTCNKHLLPKNLCPWGCSEFNHKVGNLGFDIVWQSYLQKCIIVTINPCSNIDFVQSTKNDYIRFDNEYECWLLNSNWKVKPSIAFVDGKYPCIMTCHDHDKVIKKLMVYPCRQPHHILPPHRSDQLSRVVVKSRTIKPMKASKYSNTF